MQELRLCSVYLERTDEDLEQLAALGGPAAARLGALRRLRRLELHLRRYLGVGVLWQFAQLAPNVGQLTALKLSGKQVHSFIACQTTVSLLMAM